MKIPTKKKKKKALAFWNRFSSVKDWSKPNQFCDRSSVVTMFTMVVCFLFFCVWCFFFFFFNWDGTAQSVVYWARCPA